jgi:predicted O-methyltransferase YrrM
MRKLAKLAKIIGTLASNPKSLAKVLLDPEEIAFRNQMARAYSLGNGLPTIDLLDIVPGLDETIRPFCFMNGSSRTVDLALLKALARKVPNCRYLEIGTLRGESIVNVAEIAGECVSISLSNQEMMQLGWSANYLENNGFFLGSVSNLKRIGHDSSTFDFSTVGKFDLVFVDGDHSYDGVKADTQNAFSVLRNRNSVIVWHDYGLEYEAPRWSVMAGILDGAPEHERGRIHHVSNTLCAIYLRAQYPASFVVHPAVPNKIFTVRISAEKLPLSRAAVSSSSVPE